MFGHKSNANNSKSPSVPSTGTQPQADSTPQLRDSKEMLEGLRKGSNISAFMSIFHHILLPAWRTLCDLGVT